jgi:hypothetical protein
MREKVPFVDGLNRNRRKSFSRPIIQVPEQKRTLPPVITISFSKPQIVECETLFYRSGEGGKLCWQGWL